MDQKERKFTIGRSRDCDIVLSDDSVSRRHSELIFMPDGKLFLIDCNSANGTALIKNGSPVAIRQELISPTDTLKFGDVTLPVKELLEGIHLKFKVLNPQPPATEASEPPQPKKPWIRGDRLIRCQCGAVKKANETCQECGK